MRCDLCGYIQSQKHRVLPGVWGGSYDPENVIHLCPNHHQAIHWLMRWWLKGAKGTDPFLFILIEFRKDESLWRLWESRVKAVCEERREGIRRISGPRPQSRPAPRTRMTVGQVKDVMESVNSWPPPMGVTTDIWSDPKRSKVHVHLVACRKGVTLQVEEHIPCDRIHQWLEQTANSLAGCDLRASDREFLGCPDPRLKRGGYIP